MFHKRKANPIKELSFDNYRQKTTGKNPPKYTWAKVLGQKYFPALPNFFWQSSRMNTKKQRLREKHKEIIGKCFMTQPSVLLIFSFRVIMNFLVNTSNRYKLTLTH